MTAKKFLKRLVDDTKDENSSFSGEVKEMRLEFALFEKNTFYNLAQHGVGYMFGRTFRCCGAEGIGSTRYLKKQAGGPCSSIEHPQGKSVRMGLFYLASFIVRMSVPVWCVLTYYCL
jgi:hypothetical protein